LLASAGLAAIALALGVTAATTTASAEDCGCRDRVRAALARQAPVVAAKPAARRAAPRPAPAQVASNAYAEAGYDYRGQRPVSMHPYRQRWEEAPQGYVPPPQAYGAPMEMYGPPMEAPAAYGAPMAYGPAQGMAYGQSYGEGWAYDYRPAITVDQGGWFGGVGYGMGGDGGGGGGGGGMTLTLAQPDAANGYAPGPMGAWGATNQVGQWRAEAFAPKASK
jgi:hypothetical protein